MVRAQRAISVKAYQFVWTISHRDWNQPLLSLYLYLPCDDQTMFLHVSGRSDMSLSWNVLLVIAHPTMNWWITADLVWKRPSFIWIPEWADCENNYWISLWMCEKEKSGRLRADHFCVMPTCPTLGFPLLSCACRTMSSGSGCSAVGQLCTGREGWDEGGSSSLWSHPFCRGPVSQAPNQLLLLATCVWCCVLAGTAWYRLKCHISQHALFHTSTYKYIGVCIYLKCCQYSLGWKQ